MTDLLTGTWLMTEFKVNGQHVLKKKELDLFLWYTTHGPTWYIANSYVPDGGTWQNLQCYARIADKNGSPCGEIFIPFQNTTKANWVLTSAALFIPKMAESLLQRWNFLKHHVQEVKKMNEELKMENEQLKLQLQQLEETHGPIPVNVSAGTAAAPSGGLHGGSGLLPPPPKVPKLGSYGKGRDEEGKGKTSPTAMWMATGSEKVKATGWKNYMVPLLGVSWHFFYLSQCGCLKSQEANIIEQIIL